MKREHGEGYPSGTETVAAPATVSGESVFEMPLADANASVGKVNDRSRPASQETCRYWSPDL